MIYAYQDYMDLEDIAIAKEAHRRRGRRLALGWFFCVAFVLAYFGFGVLRGLG